MRFEAPMTLVGFTALSVLIRTNCNTPCSAANSATMRVPWTLVCTASSRLGLHHGHMLVCRRMEDHLGCVLLKDPLHGVAVPYIGHTRNELHGSDPTVQFDLDIVQAGFREVHQHQPIRTERGQLAHQFAADGSSRTGHQHLTACEMGAHLVVLQLDHRAAQQVLDPHLLDLAGAQLPVDPIIDRWDGQHPHLRCHGGIHHLPAILRVGVRDGDDHLVHLFRGEEIRPTCRWIVPLRLPSFCRPSAGRRPRRPPRCTSPSRSAPASVW